VKTVFNTNKTGCAYGVGVGPGDPELITLKAVRILQEADVIACSGKRPEECAAYRIAVKTVPEIMKKEMVSISVPMTYDRLVQDKEHTESADRIAAYLEAGKDVAFLILGDPTIYSSFSYYRRILDEKGYRTEIISGVPSFCAAAAKLNISLVEWQEQQQALYSGTPKPCTWLIEAS
jgi:precorrin-2/cobalt-factor-2 C20-methyltransferase